MLRRFDRGRYHQFLPLDIEPRHPAQRPFGEISMDDIEPEGLQRDDIGSIQFCHHPEGPRIVELCDGRIEHWRYFAAALVAPDSEKPVKVRGAGNSEAEFARLLQHMDDDASSSKRIGQAACHDSPNAHAAISGRLSNSCKESGRFW